MKEILLFCLMVTVPLFGYSENKTGSGECMRGAVKDGQSPTFTHLFAFGIFEKLCKEREGENLFISPWSIGSLLAMLQNGAEGGTQDQIITALALRGYSAEYVNNHYKGLTDRLLGVESTVQLYQSNGIWVDRHYSLKSSFKELCKRYYEAETEVLDFRQASSVKVINDWANTHTRGCIPHVIDGLSPSQRVVLANAVYFKGSWESPFKAKHTRDEYFNNGDGSRSEVAMMNVRFDGLYMEGCDYEAINIAYTNGPFMMTVLLPKGGKTTEALVHRLYIGSREWEYIRRRMEVRDVSLKLPRFKMNNDLSLNSSLQALGMKSAFGESAQFGNMSKHPLWVDDIKHVSFLEVNEGGTEAAAVTMALVDADSGEQVPRVEFVVNRPFIFLIWEKDTGGIVFMGKVERL